MQVVGCPAEAVVPGATLKSLGTDSLTIVEMAEELGRRFDVYLSDDTIDAMVTVQDAITAVVRHDGSTQPPRSTSVSTRFESPAPPPPVSDDEMQHRRSLAQRWGLAFAVVGVALGAVLGLGTSALVRASGIDDVNLPPITTPTTTATTPSATPTPPPASSAPDAEPEPTLGVSSRQVSPGERFTLSGAFPASGAGVTLQVEVRDKGGDWDDFPIKTTTRDGGQFKTQIYTSRTGEREFRLTNIGAGKSTPAVTVEIG